MADKKVVSTHNVVFWHGTKQCTVCGASISKDGSASFSLDGKQYPLNSDCENAAQEIKLISLSAKWLPQEEAE
jgi:hypothetical protein